MSTGAPRPEGENPAAAPAVSPSAAAAAPAVSPSAAAAAPAVSPSAAVAAPAVSPSAAAAAPSRVVATEAALELLGELQGRFGPLLFHQSGGCCDGSAPMLFPLGEFKIGQRDVLLGTLGEAATPVYIGGAQFELWRHTQLVLDAVKGRGAGFSLEAPTGKRFITRSRVFDAPELVLLGEDPAAVDPDAVACALPD